MSVAKAQGEGNGFGDKVLKYWPIIIAVGLIFWSVVQIYYLSQGQMETLASSDRHQVEKLVGIKEGIEIQFDELDERIDERFVHLEQRMVEKFLHVDKTISFLDRRMEDLREDVKELSHNRN